jgi:hypothetical protein
MSDELSCAGCANQAQNFAQFYANCAKCKDNSNYKKAEDKKAEDKNEIDMRFIKYCLEFCAPEEQTYWETRLIQLQSKIESEK